MRDRAETEKKGSALFGQRTSAGRCIAGGVAIAAGKHKNIRREAHMHIGEIKCIVR